MDYRNEAVLAGITKFDCQVRETPNSKVCNLSVAVSDTGKDWHKATIWGSLTDVVNNLPAGSFIKLKGQLRSQKKYKSEGEYETVVSVDSKHGGQVAVLERAKPLPEQPAGDDENELPF